MHNRRNIPTCYSSSTNLVNPEMTSAANILSSVPMAIGAPFLASKRIDAQKELISQQLNNTREVEIEGCKSKERQMHEILNTVNTLAEKHELTDERFQSLMTSFNYLLAQNG